MERYPDTIELTPDATGVFHPDFNAQPSQPLAIYEPPVNPATLNQLPPPAPSYDSGSKGLSDADIADFGADEYGRPNVVRDRNGRATWNIDTELPPWVTDGATDALDDIADSKAARRSAGRLLGAAALSKALPVVGKAIEFYEATQFTGEIADAITEPIGSAIGRWARQFIDYPDPTGKPSGSVRVEGDPSVGQCPTAYTVNYSYDNYRFDGTFSNTISGTILDEPGRGRGFLYGPFEGPFTEPFKNGGTQNFYFYRDADGNRKRGPLGGNPGGTSVVTQFDPIRRDGKEDNCNEPASDKPTTPSRPTDRNERERNSPDYPPTYTPPRLPESPDYEQPEPPPELDPPPETNPPTVPDLPPETDPPETPDPPTPDPECCPSTELSLAEIKVLLNRVLNLVDGTGSGSLDLKPCDYEELIIPDGQSGLPAPETEPVTADYEGEGLQGVFDAIAAITQSLNLIREDTKCPPECDAPLPMHFETRPGEVPQLVVVWGPTSKGASRWSMSIPHPKKALSEKYKFKFPTYKKGNFHFTYRLIDNSQIILNADSEAEGQRVLTYLKSLVDPAFIDKTQVPKITKNAGQGDLKVVDVKATFIKAFAGHRDQAPLWSKRL
ncbi:hypothetical protein [cf. Phormidesmis sp. LEGE 11477]|uniref:hypothetical protein n=1 Tax=cf. Phormidesmis sp. LEGE 11477 TaxID=1828680 RepID=UPI001880E10E|nr:hypothetical protein [cf. Phormidesmis sp. LEGE 11477]MBE9064144.1 hypothetical protein [cf. Phormidesmis sp. LEGE 11477]